MTNPNSTVTTLDDTPAAPAVTEKPKAVRSVKGNNHDTELSGKRVTIIIHQGIDREGQEAVPVSINGVLYQIPRSKPTSVPEEVVEILNHATRIDYDELGGNPREVPRHNFSIQR